MEVAGCDPRDSSPSGSPVPGILQARTLEWVAISSPLSLPPDSWCEAMRKLREEGPIIKEVSDLMLARVWLPRPRGGLGGRGGEVPGRGVRWAVWCPFSLSVRRPCPGGAPGGGCTVLLLSVHRSGADQDQAAQGEPVPALHAGTLGLCLSPLKPASPVLAQ